MSLGVKLGKILKSAVVVAGEKYIEWILKNTPKHAPSGTTPTFLSPQVVVEPPFVDARGRIQNILHRPIGSVILITSKAGSVRANHWHKEDWHFCYVLRGSVEYFERPVGSPLRPDRYVYPAGDLFFTGPNVEHAMYFEEYTEFLTLARNSRESQLYEEDLVRIPDLKKQWLEMGPDAPSMDKSCGTSNDER